MSSLPTSTAGVRIDKVATQGQFCLDGGCWDVENNVWVIGNDTECIVIDAAHDIAAILAAVGDRDLLAVLCTHGHNDHINAVAALSARSGAPAYLHPEDRMLWDAVCPEPPAGDLRHGDLHHVGDVQVQVVHTPGHSPGSCCLSVPALGVVFTGDTLFSGGPGATGRSFSDFGTIIESLQTHLLSLDPDTVVLTGHGPLTTIGAEAPHLPEWIARGH